MTSQACDIPERRSFKRKPCYEEAMKDQSSNDSVEHACKTASWEKTLADCNIANAAGAALTTKRAVSQKVEVSK